MDIGLLGFKVLNNETTGRLAFDPKNARPPSENET